MIPCSSTIALEPLLEPVGIHQDAISTRPLRDEVGVRKPVRMLDALDDHAKSITLRMPSPASISSKPRLTSSSVSLCETKESTSISPAR